MGRHPYMSSLHRAPPLHVIRGWGATTTCHHYMGRHLCMSSLHGAPLLHVIPAWGATPTCHPCMGRRSNMSPLHGTPPLNVTPAWDATPSCHPCMGRHPFMSPLHGGVGGVGPRWRVALSSAGYCKARINTWLVYAGGPLSLRTAPPALPSLTRRVSFAYNCHSWTLAWVTARVTTLHSWDRPLGRTFYTLFRPLRSRTLVVRDLCCPVQTHGTCILATPPVGLCIKTHDPWDLHPNYRPVGLQTNGTRTP